MIGIKKENSLKQIDGPALITLSSSDNDNIRVTTDLRLIFKDTESTITCSLSEASDIGLEVFAINLTEYKHEIHYIDTNEDDHVFYLEPKGLLKLIYTDSWIEESNLLPTYTAENHNINGSIWISSTNNS